MAKIKRFRRSRNLCIYMTENVMVLLDDMRKESGESRSEFIRRLIIVEYARKQAMKEVLDLAKERESHNA